MQTKIYGSVIQIYKLIAKAPLVLECFANIYSAFKSRGLIEF